MEPVAASALNRVILCHFDGYSAALLFAQWPHGSLLWPAALPEGAAPGAAPAAPGPDHAVAPWQQAVADQLGLPPQQLVPQPDYAEWLDTPAGPLRVHLLRLDTFDPPAQALADAGGVFKPISALRGAHPSELPLVRQVFNLLVGGGR